MSSPARGWPLLGHYPAFYADATGFLTRLARQQGDVARFRLGRRNAFLLSHPDQVRAVLVDHASEFTKGNLLQRARRLLGDGLLTSEGEFHHAQRRCIQPVFTRARVQGYATIVPPLVARLTERWRNGERVRVDHAMNTLTMTIVARALLGADIESEAPLLGTALHRLARWAPVLTAPGGRALERTRLPGLRRFREAIERVEAVIDQAIAEGGTNAPLLSALLKAGPRGEAMPARILRDEVMTIFLAGHDTTAAALIWTWILLGRHPEVERRVQDEARTGTGESGYTEMVLREVLRLYPPIGRIGRRPVHDVQLGPLVLPRGEAVFLSPFVTQRDSRWFPEPTAFRPERWSDPEPIHPAFAYFPFGAGPRSCIGEHFARVVMSHVVTTIARSWRFRPTRPRLPALRSLLTLKPRGAVWMRADRHAG